MPYTLADYGSVTFEKCIVNSSNANFDTRDMGDMVDPKKLTKIISRTSMPSLGVFGFNIDTFTVTYVP